MNFHDAFQNRFGSPPAIMDISYENLFTPTNVLMYIIKRVFALLFGKKLNIIIPCTIILKNRRTLVIIMRPLIPYFGLCAW